MLLVVVPVQFRTVEDLLLSNKVDFAVTVADELPRSILREPLPRRENAKGFVCLYDSRFVKVGKAMSEREYFAHEHVVVSYAGDARGIIEDALGKSRNVRVSVPSFGYVADVIDGSSLVATVPSFVARHVQATRSHLRSVPLPLALDSVSLELLWSRVTDDDAAPRFVRSVVARIFGGNSGRAAPIGAAAKKAPR
jgi:LysR family transcriptional activator of mexEF-oprN operon